MLAHYAKRPVTMKRFPDGVRGKAFYEKDAPKHTPDWVHTTDVPPVTTTSLLFAIAFLLRRITVHH
jgi:bifunctional non-homologous end joining protein LigD